MICKPTALTFAFLQWRAGAHMDVINPDVACGCLFKDAFNDHLPENETKSSNKHSQSWAHLFIAIPLKRTLIMHFSHFEYRHPSCLPGIPLGIEVWWCVPPSMWNPGCHGEPREGFPLEAGHAGARVGFLHSLAGRRTSSTEALCWGRPLG